MLNQDADLNMQPFHNQIPKPIALTDETISLENDMLLGWAPKLDYSKLLTLNFNNQLNDQIISDALHNNQLIYVGFRPQDNGQMHKQYSTTSTYPFKRSKANQNKTQFPFLGMNPTCNCRIQFNSIFESGNLDVVKQVSEFEYDLYMRVDGNTQGHTSWYNFELSGMKKGEKIQLNICNFTKSHSLYERGMKPYIWRSTTQEWLYLSIFCYHQLCQQQYKEERMYAILVKNMLFQLSLRFEDFIYGHLYSVNKHRIFLQK